MNEYDHAKKKLVKWSEEGNKKIAERYLEDYKSSLDSQKQDLALEERTIQYLRDKLKWQEGEYVIQITVIKKGIDVKEKIIKLYEKALNGKPPQEEKKAIEVPV